MDSRRITEQQIVCWPDDDIALEFDLPEVISPKLAPRLKRRQDIEWFGIIRRAKGEPGGLGRLKATGALVEVFGRSLSVARPRIAAAFSAALDEELSRLLHEGNAGDGRTADRPESTGTWDDG